MPRVCEDSSQSRTNAFGNALGSSLATSSSSASSASVPVEYEDNDAGAVTFDASGSRPAPDGRIEKYTWDFGDGSFTTTTGPIATKVFTTTGSKLIKLYVTDATGRVSDVVSGGATIIP